VAGRVAESRRRSANPARPGRVTDGRPVILAVDGRSNNGKTTLAARIEAVVPGSAVIHTDDIAWQHSRFGWASLLIGGILEPVHRGRAVSYRPPRWAEHGREGSIEVPAGCPLLVIEGDGAGRREAAHLIDALIWVQSDEREAARRALARRANPDPIDRANRPAGGRLRLTPTPSGWPRSYPSTPSSGPGNGPASSSAAPRRSPATRSPKSSSHRRQARPGDHPGYWRYVSRNVPSRPMASSSTSTAARNTSRR
jgi:hypothetical protein